MGERDESRQPNPVAQSREVSPSDETKQSFPTMEMQAAEAAQPSVDLGRQKFSVRDVIFGALEQGAASSPEFSQALKNARARLESDAALYGDLGSQAAPLEGVTFADAVVRSMYNDARDPAWIRLAGQVVQVDAFNSTVTIWRTYTDEQKQAQAPGFDWGAINKLHAEATLAATHPATKVVRLQVLDAPATS